ncbi:hypothetical protein [Advenella kashmirensis]|uniref:hypothetical protein n=1 Tax=Advenella kashmirensis TaxID=310575 RepID=UPI0012DC7314|nr:hypothetical protein [Advenella kashmirensis]
MSVDNIDFLNFSSAILTPTASEIEIRAAISRAYYCAYHSAKDFHHGLDSPGSARTDNCGVHETLIRQLINPTIRSSKLRSKSRSIGYLCRSLKSEREAADYDLKCNLEITTGRQVIAETYSLLEHISSS